MGLFGNNSTVQTTFTGKDNLSPVVRGIHKTMDQFKRDAATGFGLGAGIQSFNLAGKAIGFVTDAIGDSIKAASDMNETQTKLDAVFKSSADTVRAWAKDSATSMGMSKQAALEAAGTFGNFLEALGSAEPEAARMSTTLVTLAGDLASFNNQDPTEVLAALKSGIAGEIEPMRRFGVDISDAAVKTYLLAQGLKTVGGQFTQAQKVQGRYNLILKQTTTAQGDFKRTASGLANSTRTFNSNVANLQVGLGQLVQGPATEFVGFLSDVITTIARPGGVSDSAKEMVADIHNIGKAMVTVTPQTQAYADKVEAIRKELEATASTRGTGGIDTGQFSAVFEPAREWVQKLGPQFIALSGQTVASLQLVAEESLKAGESFEQYRSRAFALANGTKLVVTSIVDAWRLAGSAVAPEGETIVATADLVGKEFRYLARSASTLKRDFDTNLGALVGITKGSLKAAKTEAQKGMADIVWSLKHPLAGAKLEQFYGREVRAGTRAMNHALATGNHAAYVKASQFVADYKAKLAELRNEQFHVTVQTDFITKMGGIPGLGSYSRPKHHKAIGGAASGTIVAGEYGPEVIQLGSAKANVQTAQQSRGDTVLMIDGYELFRWVDKRLGRQMDMA